MTIAPITTVPAVRRIGLVRTAPASITERSREPPSALLSSMKSMRSTEFLTMIPARAIIPIIEVAVKNAPWIQCPGMIPTRLNGMAIIMTSGVLNDWNHADREQIDDHENDGERAPEIPEHLVRDLPLPVPLHREILFEERLPRVERLDPVRRRGARSARSSCSSRASRRSGSPPRRRRRR